MSAFDPKQTFDYRRPPRAKTHNHHMMAAARWMLPSVRRQNIWRNSRCRLAECRPHPALTSTDPWKRSFTLSIKRSFTRFGLLELMRNLKCSCGTSIERIRGCASISRASREKAGMFLALAGEVSNDPLQAPND